MSKRKPNDKRGAVRLGKPSPKLPANARKLTPPKMGRFAIDFLNDNPDYEAAVEDALARQHRGPGRFRGLSVKAFIVGALVASLEGKLLAVDIFRSLIELPEDQQDELSLTWTQPNGKTYELTARRVGYLKDQICEAMAPTPAKHSHPVEESGLILQSVDGEVMAQSDHLTEAEITEICACPVDCPGRVPPPGIEAWINGILRGLWAYLEIPESDTYAVDSYVIETHFRTRSYGGVANIDPQWVPDPIKSEVSTDVARTTSTARVRTREDLKTAAAEFIPDAGDPRSRKPAPIGPTIPGDFTRIDTEFPQAGPEGRLHHTVDEGAANAYRGAGNSRQGGILNGRDKHVAAAAGHLPNGTPFPAFPRAFVCTMGGESKDDALTLLQSYAPTVLSAESLTAVDRGYLRTPEMVAEIRQHDVDVIHDLRDDERGRKIWKTGIDLVDGWFYSSSLPASLVALPRLARNATTEDRQRSQARFDERTPHAFRPMGKTSSGALRFRGPAVPIQTKKDRFGRVIEARGMTVKCPNSSFSHLADAELPVTLCQPGETCGCSMTFSVAAKDLPKHLEPHRWGSSEWARLYGRRNLAETYNSTEQYHQRLGKHSIRVHAKRWDLFHGLLTVGLFIGQVFNWLQRIGAHTVRSQGYEVLDRAVIRACMRRVSKPARRTDDSPDPPATAV